MLNIIYINGSIDGTVELDPSQLTGDLSADRISAYVQGLSMGKMASFDTNGYAKLAEDGDLMYGVLVNNAAGADYENVPALASGKVSMLIGGSVVETDAVVENDLVPGDKLYLAPTANKGKLTKTNPGTAIVAAVVRTANSASDLMVRIQILA